MRIGIDARFYSSHFTGIGRYVFELIKNLAQIDKKNEYVIFLNEPQFSEFELPNHRFKKVLADAHHYSISEQWGFWRKLEKEKLDLMHFTHFNAPLLYRKRSVVTIHDLTLSLFPGAKMTSFIHRVAYHLIINSIAKRAKSVIAVSQNTKKDIEKFLKTPKEKIHTIYEAAGEEFRLITDHTARQKFLQKYELTRPYLLYTGVWRSHKNLPNLLRSFALLRNRYDLDIDLVMTGRPDPHYPEVIDTIQDNQLSPYVRMPGLVPEEDLIMFYNCAASFVMPSLYEGFGLPLLEAFACGAPVCSSNASCLPEVAGEGNAIFFDPHNPEDMAEKIADLLRSPEKQAELRARGLKRTHDFSWDKMAHETLKIYTNH
ncbi:glycosyltransferase family 4 protein [Candidatus Gracilibacteria bacterium]|nr:glycosyltransferase family 4 protein [Candidatus Gracilibacteria bacterium]